MGDLSGYLRSERWMELPLLLAAMAASGLIVDRKATAARPVRPAWVVLLAVGVLIFGNVYWVLKLSETGVPVRLLASDGDQLAEGVVAALTGEDD